MKKEDIVRELVKHTELTKPQAEHAIEALVEIVSEALIKGEPIMLRGFGTIKTVQRAAKPARDIGKGKMIMLPPRKQVKFVAYNELNERVNCYGHHAILP